MQMQQYDDQHYISQVLNGNMASYRFLVDKYKNLAFTIAFKILRNHEDAEEVAMDGFLKAFQSLKNFKGGSKFSTWFYRIVYNSAISRTRQKRIFFQPVDNYLPFEDISEDTPFGDLNHIDIQEQVDTLEKSIQKLEDDEALLIEMFYRHECSIDDIADITGYSAANVKVKLFRTRKKLLLLINSSKGGSSSVKTPIKENVIA